MHARDFTELTHIQYGKPQAWWRYSDSLAVASFVGRRGRRIRLPAVRDGKACFWHTPAAPLPLYNATALAARPGAPVIVAQSEEAAEAAAILDPDIVSTTWPGGPSTVDKVDIALLAGRDIVLTPDNESQSRAAMERLRERLKGHARRVQVLELPRECPPGWSLAWSLADLTEGAIAERMSEDAVAAPGADRVPQPAPAAPAAPPQRQAGTGEARIDAGRAPPAPAADPWPEPDLSLLDERYDAPAFPVRLLHGLWQGWIEDVARGASAPADYVALSLITAAASLVGGSRRVVPMPGWAEPCVLWTVLAGPAASGKTRALDASLRLLSALEETILAAVTEAQRRRARAYKDSLPPWGTMAEEAEARAVLPPMPPLKSGPRQFVSNERVLEPLLDVLARNPRGVLLLRDQHASWLDAFMRAPVLGGERNFWLAAWSAVPFIAGARYAALRSPPAVSILGTVQPESLAALADKADEDGLLTRFLFACPQRRPVHRLAERAPAHGAALDALRRLAELPDATRDLPLADDARTAFDAFRLRHHAEGEVLDGRDAAWWARGAGMVLRLAGVLTLLDWAAGADGAAEPDTVPARAIDAAATLWQDYLWPHARAAFHTTGASRYERQARRVLHWLKRQGATRISSTQMRRKALSDACDAAQTQRVADELVRAGWLRPLAAERAGAGRPQLLWAVNRAWLAQPTA